MKTKKVNNSKFQPITIEIKFQSQDELDILKLMKNFNVSVPESIGLDARQRLVYDNIFEKMFEAIND